MRAAPGFACLLVAAALLPTTATAQIVATQSGSTAPRVSSIMEQVRELNRLRAGAELDEPALAQLRFEHPRLAEYLTIEPALEKRVLKLLREHALEDGMSGRSALMDPRIAERYATLLALEHAQEQARRFEQLREVLGTERLQRFQAYQRSLHLRRQIAAFDLELPPLDRLTAEQTERMVELLMQAQESSAPALLQRPVDMFIGNPRGNPAAGDIWQTQETIARHEFALHLLEVVTDLTLPRLPSLLRREQVRAFAEFQAAEINRRREAIARLRHAADLPDAIPGPPAVMELPLPTT